MRIVTFGRIKDPRNKINKFLISDIHTQGRGDLLKSNLNDAFAYGVFKEKFSYEWS